YQALPDTPDRPANAKALEPSYVAVADSVFDANADNAVGYYVFVNQAYDMSLDQLNDALAKYPRFRNSKRVANLLTAAENKERTAVGQKFVDFEIAADSTVQRLSDYVGKGRYVLVDFWASWCGPCIRETAVIKDIYKKYGPEGTGQLDVLGVAVWDEPQNTRSAIERHKLPWPQIINAQSVPTDLYGVSGIPAIFIFAPDGTIVSRGKQGDELRADIARLLDSAPATQAD
ncbi:MAG: TlpA family protein disulfide reductase, partial [Muribaculaceae bacterium]|nr:TlpA family protein disulfide reductase [Muribaculaceae bacterium]